MGEGAAPSAAAIAGVLAASAVLLAACASGGQSQRRAGWHRAASRPSRSGTTDRALGGGESSSWSLRRLAKHGDDVQGQLADAVSAVAAASRSGLSIPQAIAVAADQTSDPMGTSLKEIAEQTGLGSPLDDALDRWVAAIPIPDVRLVAAVLHLHRRTGGALPDALDSLSHTLRERRSVVREVRSLTAQARLSGAILGLLPIGFFVFLSVTSRGDMVDALTSPMGRTSIVVGLFLQGVAFLWIRRLLRVEP